MNCLNCQQENLDGASFCSKCGTGLPVVCSNCGKTAEHGTAYCSSCGSQIYETSTQTGTGLPRFVSQSAPVPESFVSGRYRVQSALGLGSTKSVYLVRDTLLDRDVAFALINTIGIDESDRERILREARTMARLGEHPNIMQIYEFGEENGLPFMVLPLMTGGTAEAIVKKAQTENTDFNTVLRLALDVSKGLSFAHSNGVIHRDLKPGNVWLTAEGVAKIGDFGIAFSPAYTRMTMAGAVLGTVAYMSPEQAMGSQVDERSDLYSFGAMLYELATGQPPFQGDHPVAVISQHINVNPVPPSRVNPSCPPAMEQIILRLLAKDPQERFGSASLVQEALEELGAEINSGVTRSVVPEAEQKPIRVLFVDDSEADVGRLLLELESGGYAPTWERVSSPIEMDAALTKQTWDVVLCEFSMGRFSAPAALKVLEMNGLDLPFIIVSHHVSEEIAVEAMKTGAHDYLTKENLTRLNIAVERELQEAIVRGARREKEEEERRIHAQLEQRVRELTSLNKMFQDHMRERAEIVQAYRELVDGLQRLPQGLQAVANDVGTLVKRALEQPIPEMQDIPGENIESRQGHVNQEDTSTESNLF